jgi:hypothetical protein
MLAGFTRSPVATARNVPIAWEGDQAAAKIAFDRCAFPLPAQA